MMFYQFSKEKDYAQFFSVSGYETKLLGGWMGGGGCVGRWVGERVGGCL